MSVVDRGSACLFAEVLPGRVDRPSSPVTGGALNAVQRAFSGASVPSTLGLALPRPRNSSSLSSPTQLPVHRALKTPGAQDARASWVRWGASPRRQRELKEPADAEGPGGRRATGLKSQQTLTPPGEGPRTEEPVAAGEPRGPTGLRAGRCCWSTRTPEAWHGSRGGAQPNGSSVHSPSDQISNTSPPLRSNSRLSNLPMHSLARNSRSASR